MVILVLACQWRPWEEDEQELHETEKVLKRNCTTESPGRHPCKQITVHLHISKTFSGGDPYTLKTN